MKKTLVFLFVLIAAPAYAQTPITRGPLPVGAKVAWETPPNVLTLADAQSFEPRLNRNGTPMTALTAVTCVAAAPGFTCTSVLSASNRDALNQIGVHALTLSLFRPDVGDSQLSAPFTLTSPAGAATGLRITP